MTTADRQLITGVSVPSGVLRELGSEEPPEAENVFFVRFPRKLGKG